MLYAKDVDGSGQASTSRHIGFVVFIVHSSMPTFPSALLTMPLITLVSVPPRLNWDPPLSASECVLSPELKGRGDTHLGWGTIFDDRRKSLVLCLLCGPELSSLCPYEFSDDATERFIIDILHERRLHYRSLFTLV
jgi:hypothetical protein